MVAKVGVNYPREEIFDSLGATRRQNHNLVLHYERPLPKKFTWNKTRINEQGLQQVKAVDLGSGSKTLGNHCPICSARPGSRLQAVNFKVLDQTMKKKKIVIARFACLSTYNRTSKEFCAASQTVAIVQTRFNSLTECGETRYLEVILVWIWDECCLFIKIANRKSLWLNRVKQVMRKICPTGVKQNLWNALFGKVWNILAQNLTICIFFTGVL